ncbi:MAG: TonB-dependent receptor [Rhodothalassiaceae bacterium]
MTRLRHSCFGAAKALLLLSASVPAMMLAQQSAQAQQITSGVQGTVLSPDGTPVANARVTVTDSRTGRALSQTTGNAGRFNFSGLEVGGPYTVLIESDRYQTERVEGLTISLSSASNLTIQLSAGAIEEIVITAAATVTTQLAIGPAGSFGPETLANFPSLDRDIRDMIRIDPRVTINEGNDDSISCLGGNNRSNSFTIDGVQSQDGFGLNASGFPNRNNLPIPFDAVRQASVEFAPFDVEYGRFTGCNVNLVTKSGENEFHGSAFGVFNSSGLTGKKIDGETVREGSFRDWNWGATISGPIIKDRLWFFGAYEEVKDGGVVVTTGPSGAGFAQELDFLTIDQANQIADALATLYDRDVIGLARNLPDKSRRWLGRIDWQITDQHRAAFTYSRLRELRQDPDDAFGFNDFSFLDNFENEGTESESYALRIFSDWTDNFRTEIRVSRLDVQDIQGPVGGGEAQDPNPIPRIIIDNITNPANGATGDLVSGPGFSRSANDLRFQVDQIKIKGEYNLGDHTITAGYELDQLDVFNLFVQDATGTITFNSVADFLAGTASQIIGNGSFTGDINDAAAQFSRSIHSLYLQDEWQATQDLTLQVGLRYDFYASSDHPIENPIFEQKFGFKNTQAFQGLDILQPRFGFTYEAGETLFGETQIRGGVGIFSGADPTVWFANNFQNFGGAIGSGISSAPPCTAADLQVLDANGRFTGIPQCITDQQIANATANRGSVNAVDPNFKIPSVLRLNAGFSHWTDFDEAAGGFFDDWNIQFDVIHTRNRNAVDWVNLALTKNGLTAPDGRPLFSAIDPLRPGCDAVFQGIRKGFTGSNLLPGGPCITPFNDDEEILLTNVDGKDGSATTISAIFSKTFEHNAFNVPGSVYFSFGYAWSDANAVNSANSSTASSSFEENATSVLNDFPLANNQFVNRHNITIAASFTEEFFDDLKSNFSMFFRARSGNFFSFVFDDRSADSFGDSDREARHLFYVPTGPSDPLVNLSALSAADQQALFDFIQNSKLAKFQGQIAPRNVFRDPWTKDLDVRFSQELPGFFGTDKFQIFVDIDNFLNLVDNGANIQRRFDRGDVGEGVPVVRTTISNGQYRFSNFTLPEVDEINVNSSLWAVQFGVRYSF